ncbi:Fe-S oxidoreductase [Desulfosporosinus orientis DSM 765]|uniref:Glycolate oxidase iron-sulfur subunit n=1 Tax=Desulfosporosinus orientis (strain ATCC 19365 / DSM 765 / NCIMB 8382 / VKM B-1628 / Singapore I) TaxID=768706 RepID=G7WC16_DESOD|nr:(Fe-S)-binding protein [Desulfosporosinus orientis]AET69990.1 Fe-S oxidoreductase [Desulfosporosinus orientis DSM 765]
MKTTYQVDFAEELKKCVRCGECRANCPIFAESKREPDSPRGRLSLVKLLQEGKIPPSSELSEKLYGCLLCKTCAVKCPSGVITDEIVMGVRDYLDSTLDRNIVKKLVLRGFLTRPALLQASFSLVKLYQKTGLNSVLTRSKLIEHLPEQMSAGAKILPDVSKQPARGRIAEVVKPYGKKRFRVAYFLGCATNLIYPDVAVTGVDVLARHGCEVVTPAVKCCGMPHLAYGDTDTAVQLAKKNLKILLSAQVDAVVTDCSSCSATLAESYLKLFEPGTDEYNQAKELSSKVYDLSKFLVEKTGVHPGPNPVKVAVTYHDPCHLKRGQNVFKQPRELLMAIPGVEFREMKEADRCCGSAGSFSIMHHDLSMKVLDRKITNIVTAKAEVVATSCPTCTMQLSYGLKSHGLAGHVVHPVQLLARTY